MNECPHSSSSTRQRFPPLWKATWRVERTVPENLTWVDTSHHCSAPPTVSIEPHHYVQPPSDDYELQHAFSCFQGHSSGRHQGWCSRVASINTMTMQCDERWSLNVPLHAQPTPGCSRGSLRHHIPFVSFPFFLDPVSIKRCICQVYLGVSGLTRSGRKKSQKKQKITKHKKSSVFQVCCPASLPSTSLTRALVLFVRSLIRFLFISFKRVRWLGPSLQFHSRISAGIKN